MITEDYWRVLKTNDKYWRLLTSTEDYWRVPMTPKHIWFLWLLKADSIKIDVTNVEWESAAFHNLTQTRQTNLSRRSPGRDSKCHSFLVLLHILYLQTFHDYYKQGRWFAIIGRHCDFPQGDFMVFNKGVLLYTRCRLPCYICIISNGNHHYCTQMHI